jgi:hypothetical protein
MSARTTQAGLAFLTWSAIVPNPMSASLLIRK